MKQFALIFFKLLLLVGCSFGPSVEEEIYQHLEKAVASEKVFEEQQKPLVELGNKEQELYEEIISLGMAEFEKIKELSQQTLKIVEERKSRIQKEKESIEASKEEFLLVEPLIAKIEDEELKKNAEKMYETMIKRYEAYDNLHTKYMEALTLDEELYKKFQKEDLTLEELDKQIDKINASYEAVVEANKTFNSYTDKYNQLKRDFYKQAGLNVVYESENGNTSK